ncbi:P-loop NTPase family protein [Lachnoclostridium phytofermentans]|uniref:Uncharacterized protein n=1 Tax=Lachnoclostridium phytofermentans (strain ATCC 700394 / DSM 18823 / ISDg) TaxID=357809 RepID=A9KQB2_LACP7|nr:hypothetical protein [Lachnoclostridium phytofermentans]ABX40421.1 hypothetical protein Cphy_0031 [Lachnoclostridium phytofermentans ISDg]
MKITVAILDRQEDYARLLMEFMNQQADYGFFTVAFTEEELYRDFEKDHKVDILLYAEEFREGMITNLSKVSYCLCEDTSFSNESIFKYQSASNIMNLLLERYIDLGYTWKPVTKNTGKQKVIGVFSPCYEIRQSHIAIILAKYLATKEKCVYLCLQPIFPSEILGYGEHSSLSDVIYLLKQDGANKSVKIKQCLEQVGELNCILGTYYFAEIYELTFDEIINLITELKENLLYETIVIDFSLYTSLALDLLKVCDVLLMPQLAGEARQCFSIAFEEQLKRTGQDQLLEKLVQIVIPYEEQKQKSIRLDKQKEAEYQQILKELQF